MSSRLRWTQRQLVVATGALVASALGLAATRPDVTLDVQTATVSRGPVDHQIVATGTLQAVSTVDVSSPVAGIVQSLDVDVNTPVHAGDIVARLDASSYETALRDARAAEERARARVLDLQAAEQAARSTLLRDELLGAQNVVAHGDLEAVRAATTDATVDVRSAESDLTTAEAAVRAAADDLERTVIRAPVDGVVIVRNVEVGQTLTATMESPVLFRIARGSARYAAVSGDERTGRFDHPAGAPEFDRRVLRQRGVSRRSVACGAARGDRGGAQP